jgi:hypothetical protein
MTKLNDFKDGIVMKTTSGRVIGRSLLAAVLLVAVSHGLAATLRDADDCPPSVKDFCHSQPFTISETAHGAVNGRNNTFELSRAPDTQMPVKVFLDGIPLVRGVDYRINDRALVTSSAAVPRTGDTLMIVYTPQPVGINPENLPDSPQSFASEEQLNIAAAAEALRTEESWVSRSLSVRANSSGRTSETGEPEISSASVRMLVQQAAQSPALLPNVKKREPSLDGVDGLGDQGIATSSLPSFQMNANVLSDVEAVRMLQRRLLTSAPEPTSERSKRHSSGRRQWEDIDVEHPLR